MADKDWPATASVTVVGVDNGVITSGGSGVQKFDTLAAAQLVFPDLDPHNSTQRFTGAMGLPSDNVMRFETWAAYDLYSR